MKRYCKGLSQSRLGALLCIYIALAFAQVPDTLWTKIYGVGGPFEWFQSVQQLADSGYILTGEWDEDLLLMRTNSHGDSLWTKTYGEAGEDCGFCVRSTSDGGYIITGLRATGSGDVWLLKTNANGDTLWTKTYSGPQDDIGFWGQQIADGGYIFFGQTESFGGLYGAWLLKTDSLGDTLWTKVYEDFTGTPGKPVYQTNDRGYILAVNKIEGIAWNACVIKTDSLGDTLWTRSYNGLGSEIFSSLTPTSDGGYVLAGYTGEVGALLSDGWLVKIDSLGDSLWAHIYGGPGYEEFRSISETTEDGFILAGVKSPSPMSFIDVWLMKTNSAGDSIWARTWGTGQADDCNDVHVCYDRGYVLAGATFLAGVYDDAWLLKTEPDVGITENENQHVHVQLFEISPNPFRHNTTIRYTVHDPGYTITNRAMSVYDAAGRLVKSFNLGSCIPGLAPRSGAGMDHASTISWDGTDQANRPLPSGVYLLKLDAGDYSATEKLLLIR